MCQRATTGGFVVEFANSCHTSLRKRKRTAYSTTTTRRNEVSAVSLSRNSASHKHTMLFPSSYSRRACENCISTLSCVRDAAGNEQKLSALFPSERRRRLPPAKVRSTGHPPECAGQLEPRDSLFATCDCLGGRSLGTHRLGTHRLNIRQSDRRSGPAGNGSASVLLGDNPSVCTVPR